MSPTTDKPPQLKLNDSLDFTPSVARGKLRYVVEDRTRQRFLRVGRREYLLATAFNGQRSVAEAVEAAKRGDAALAWTERFVADALRWLTTQGLVVPASVSPRTSGPTPAQTPTPPKRLDPFSFKLQLLSGQSISRLVSPVAARIQRGAIAAAVCLMIVGFTLAAANWTRLTQQSIDLIVAESKLYWLAAWVVMKLVHEFGHAAAAARFGAKTGGAGVSFFCLAPIPFVDVTDIWRRCGRRSRIACNLAGMFAELTVAAAAACIWCLTDSPALQYFCGAIIAVGGIATIAFNANPLLRYDAYYVVSDLLDRPTLWADAQAAVRTRVKWFWTAGEAPPLHHAALAAYGVGTVVYRVVLFGSLAAGAVAVWQTFGVLLIAAAGYFWFLGPSLAQRRLRAANSQLAGTTANAKGSALRRSFVVCSVLAGLVLVLRLPCPWLDRVPGVVAYRDLTTIHPQGEGVLIRFMASSGERVEAGQPLAELADVKLRQQIEELRLDVLSSRAKAASATASDNIAEMQQHLVEAAKHQRELDALLARAERLWVRAPQPGRFYSRLAGRASGQYVTGGDVLGYLIADDSLQVELSIPQDQVARYREAMRCDSSDALPSDPKETAVEINLAAGGGLSGQLLSIDPSGSRVLHTPVLAAAYGGPLAVQADSSAAAGESRLLTKRPRVRAVVKLPANAEAQLVAGQRCSCVLAERHRTVAEILSAAATRLWQNVWSRSPDQSDVG